MCVLGVEGSEKKNAAHPPEDDFWNSPNCILIASQLSFNKTLIAAFLYVSHIQVMAMHILTFLFMC